MNCRECQWHREQGHTHHLQCAVGMHEGKGLAMLMLVLRHGAGAFAAIGIEVSNHGFKKGWANWPMDYDPYWIESCAYFRPMPELPVDKMLPEEVTNGRTK